MYAKGRVVLIDMSIKSNLTVAVGAESPQVDRLYIEKHKAEGAEFMIHYC